MSPTHLDSLKIHSNTDMIMHAAERQWGTNIRLVWKDLVKISNDTKIIVCKIRQANIIRLKKVQ